jgi:hypothetical protein
MNHKDYNDEQTINSLVDQYKETGSEDLRIQLVNEFEGYFSKYAHLLCSSAPINLDNKDTITFLRLFMTDEERLNEQSVYKAARRIINYLRSLFRDWSKQDMHDELVVYFLEQLNRYSPMIANHKHDKPRISFVHFMQVNLRFKVKSLIMSRQKDALSCSFNVEYNDELNTYRTENNGVGTNWSELDVRWIRGLTAGDIFRELSEMDRYLLYLKYEKNTDKPLSDYSLARITGMDRMYIRRRMLLIKDKIKELADIT